MLDRVRAAGRAAELRTEGQLDALSPGLQDGIEATRRIVESGGRSRVLVLTTFDLDEYAYDALRAGDSVISPGPTRKSIDAFTTRMPGQDKRLAELTERDRVQAALFAYAAGPVRPV
ncbi:hypothetical protein IQ63_20690 [Streptomyces acidiscabies]|uniref:Uncharacterized protein n=1 Tax=Streptomyces acidiscabies TaxID=42234 RepID=A0A0L0K632_9ACTN|nr:hypothetical protein IQ63_20690 [Streptomyces acidiscabies]